MSFPFRTIRMNTFEEGWRTMDRGAAGTVGPGHLDQYPDPPLSAGGLGPAYFWLLLFF